MTYKKLFIAIFILTAAMSLSPVRAAHGPEKDLRGPAFTDPSEKLEMPEEWVKKPVRYEPADADADVVVTLDGQLYQAWVPIIRNYAKKHGLKISVYHGSCGLSAGKLSAKTLDTGGFCCPPALTDRLPGLRFHTLGIAPIVLIVHPDNPVDDITIEQARKIFQGEIYNWSVLNEPGKKNVPDLRIQPVARLHCKIRPGHWRLLLDNDDLFSPMLMEVGAIPDMIVQVAVNQGAIGYEVLWTLRYHSDKGITKHLKINGYDPEDTSHLLSGRYPLYRVYNLTTWEGENVENPHAQKLVDHMLEQVKNLNSKYNFVPSSSLRKAGWKFLDDELIGEPGE